MPGRTRGSPYVLHGISSYPSCSFSRLTLMRIWVGGLNVDDVDDVGAFDGFGGTGGFIAVAGAGVAAG